jgi:large subunit ribosomal protein L15
MHITELVPAKGSRKRNKRVGRGPGCHGKTSGKGSNGQNSRSGGGKAPGFEGGQTPWFRRLPKYKGFKSLNKTVYSIINLSNLEKSFAADEEVTLETIMAKGLVKNLYNPVKVLGDGNLSKPLVVKLHKFTKAAKERIESAGGKVEEI